MEPDEDLIHGEACLSAGGIGSCPEAAPSRPYYKIFRIPYTQLVPRFAVAFC
jgi:hypothetical protein